MASWTYFLPLVYLLAATHALHRPARNVEGLELSLSKSFPVHQETYTFVNRLCVRNDALYVTYFQQEPIVTMDTTTYSRLADINLQLGPEGAYLHSHWSLFPSANPQILYVLDIPFGSAYPKNSVIWRIDVATGAKKIWLELAGVIAFSVSQFSGRIIVLEKSTSTLTMYDKNEQVLEAITLPADTKDVCDIAELPDGNIVMLRPKTPGSNTYVVSLYDTTGKLLASAELVTEAGGQELYSTLAVDATGSIFVNSVKQIFALNKDLSSARLLLKAFATSDSNIKPFWMTGLFYSLATDNLYVAAYEVADNGMQLTIKVYDVATPSLYL